MPPLVLFDAVEPIKPAGVGHKGNENSILHQNIRILAHFGWKCSYGAYNSGIYDDQMGMLGIKNA